VAVTYITWIWGDKYGEDDVNKLAAGIRRNTRQNFRFVVFSDRKLKVAPPIEVKTIEDKDLIGRGCFCRLRMFDPEWQKRHGFDDVMISLDLDLVITANVDTLFKRKEKFLILKGVNAVNPNPLNCSLMMLRAGAMADIWQKFSLEAAETMKYHEFPDDQGWIWHRAKVPDGWVGGPSSGVYAFMKPGWPFQIGQSLPRGAVIVAFVGSKKPSQFSRLDWVARHWRSGL
jgi:hypothetical protein